MINVIRRVIFVLLYPILGMFQGLVLFSLSLFQLLYWVIYGKFKFSYKEIENILEYTEKKLRKYLIP